MSAKPLQNCSNLEEGCASVSAQNCLLDVMEAMRKEKIEPKRVRFVQKRGDTAPWLFLVEGRKGGNRFLKVEQPLIIQDENGDFSTELKKIYRLI